MATTETHCPTKVCPAIREGMHKVVQHMGVVYNVSKKEEGIKAIVHNSQATTMGQGVGCGSQQAAQGMGVVRWGGVRVSSPGAMGTGG